jgi:hypothetical protein
MCAVNPKNWAGGRQSFLKRGDALDGKCRTLFGGLISGKARTVIGSNTQLHSLIGSAVDDITPDGLAAGNADEIYGQGYGMGKYGVGLYGMAKVSTTARRFPRIWHLDFSRGCLLDGAR